MAKIYLSSTDTNFVVANNNSTVIGTAAVAENVLINAGVTGVTVDNTVEVIDFAGAAADYRFEQGFGSNITVKDASGNTIMTLTDVAGKKLTFTDGTATLAYDDATKAMTLGGTAVTKTSAPVVPTLDTTDKSTVAGGTATPTPVAGQTFTLTASAAGEILVGTTKNDTFSGDKDSIDAADKLVDGSTTDNETANLTFNASLPTLTIANVENVNVTLSNIGTTSVAATNFSGIKNLTVTKADVTVGSSTLAGNKAVTVTAVNADNIAKITAGAATTDVTVDQATKAGVIVAADVATGVIEVLGAATVDAANATKVNLTGILDATEDAKAVVINAAKATTINVGSNTDATTYDNPGLCNRKSA